MRKKAAQQIVWTLKHSHRFSASQSLEIFGEIVLLDSISKERGMVYKKMIIDRFVVIAKTQPSEEAIDLWDTFKDWLGK